MNPHLRIEQFNCMLCTTYILVATAYSKSSQYTSSLHSTFSHSLFFYINIPTCIALSYFMKIEGLAIRTALFCTIFRNRQYWCNNARNPCIYIISQSEKNPKKFFKKISNIFYNILLLHLFFVILKKCWPNIFRVHYSIWHGRKNRFVMRYHLWYLALFGSFCHFFVAVSVN